MACNNRNTGIFWFLLYFKGNFGLLIKTSNISKNNGVFDDVKSNKRQV